MIEIRVPEMRCQGCAERVKAVLLQLDPDIQVAINLATKLVEIRSDKTHHDLVGKLRAAGFAEAT